MSSASLYTESRAIRYRQYFEEIYSRGDKIAGFFILGFFLTGILCAFTYDTWGWEWEH
jgi:hypothetical protein